MSFEALQRLEKNLQSSYFGFLISIADLKITFVTMNGPKYDGRDLNCTNVTSP
jgi:hypothetical protein